MTVPTEQVKQFANGNGVTTSFFFGYRLLLASDMTVYVDSQLVLPANYTVNINPNGVGGTVTFNTPPDGGVNNVLLYRVVDYLQLTHFPNESDFDQVSLEDAVDKLAMGEQQLAEEILRCLQYPVTAADIPNLILKLYQPGMAIGWDPNNFSITNLPISGEVTGITGPTGATGATGASGDAALQAGSAWGLTPVWVNNSSIQIQSGTCPDDTATFGITVGSPVTANLATSGVNGLMTGQVEAANTWYNLYLIADSTNTNPVASLFVPSGVSVVLPAGYDKQRYNSAWRNNGSSNLIKADVVGGYAGRFKMLYIVNETCMGSSGGSTTVTNGDNQVLSNGSAATFTAIPNLTKFIPPTSTLGNLHVVAISTGDVMQTHFQPTGAGLSKGFGLNGWYMSSQNIEVPTNSSQSIDYYARDNVGASPVSIDVRGFTDTQDPT